MSLNSCRRLHSFASIRLNRYPALYTFKRHNPHSNASSTCDMGEPTTEALQQELKPKTNASKSKDHRGGKPPNRDVLISKALSKLLRHDAEKHKLKLDEEGYAPVEKVLAISIIKSTGCTLPDIHHAVVDNAKQRFAMKPSPAAMDPPNQDDPSHFLIRANQGHSIPLESAAFLTHLTPESIPDTVVHGTYHALYALILASGGLRAMSRNHIHFSKGLPEENGAKVISGMRNDSELLIYIDVKKSMDDGLEWWISDNGVVLTEGDKDGKVAPKYWKKVVGRKGSVGVLWEDGVEVGKMPEGVKGKKITIGKAQSQRGKGKSGKVHNKVHRDGKKEDEEEKVSLAAAPKDQEKGIIEEAARGLEALASVDPPLVVETATTPQKEDKLSI